MTRLHDMMTWCIKSAEARPFSLCWNRDFSSSRPHRKFHNAMMTWWQLKIFCTPANAVSPFQNRHFLTHRPPQLFDIPTLCVDKIGARPREILWVDKIAAPPREILCVDKMRISAPACPQESSFPIWKSTNGHFSNRKSAKMRHFAQFVLISYLKIDQWSLFLTGSASVKDQK